MDYARLIKWLKEKIRVREGMLAHTNDESMHVFLGGTLSAYRQTLDEVERALADSKKGLLRIPLKTSKSLA